MTDTPTGVALIADERHRQHSDLGWTAEHDASHKSGSLAVAAACYAAPFHIYRQFRARYGFVFRDPWPFPDFDKRSLHRFVDMVIPTDERLRELCKAGALIAAEIDRLLATGGS